MVDKYVLKFLAMEEAEEEKEEVGHTVVIEEVVETEVDVAAIEDLQEEEEIEEVEEIQDSEIFLAKDKLLKRDTNNA